MLYQTLLRWKQPKSAILILIAFSLVFYAWWNPDYLWILIGSIVINYALSRLLIILRETSASLGIMVLVLSIAGNLAVLAHYKYWCLWGGVEGCESVILPLAISFFSFQQIEFLLDTWNGKASAQSFASYTVFITFFPHLIAGPITRHSEMMPQFDRPSSNMLANISIGLTLFSIGLAKKAFLADPLGVLAEPGFASVASGKEVPFLVAWISAIGFTLQLYFDFSGYSDMAIGISRMFGIRLPLNFNSPFKASNIVDFWQRWHLTLTRYINAHLYNPLVAYLARRTTFKMGAFLHQLTIMAVPTVLVMTVAGIWHGAGAQFVVFGLIHGVMLAGYQLFRWSGRQSDALSSIRQRIPYWLSVVITFILVVVSFVFFKSASINDALSLLSGMAGKFWATPPGSLSQLGPIQYLAFMSGKEDLRQIIIHLPYGYFELLLIPVGLAIVWWAPNSQEVLSNHLNRGEGANLISTSPVQYRVVPLASRIGGFFTWNPSLLSATLTILLLIGALMKANFSSTAFLYFRF